MFVNSGHQKGTNVLSAQGNWLTSDKPGLSLRSAFWEMQSTCDILIFYVAHSQDDNCHPQRLSLQSEPRGSGALSGPYPEGLSLHIVRTSGGCIHGGWPPVTNIFGS